MAEKFVLPGSEKGWMWIVRAVALGAACGVIGMTSKESFLRALAQPILGQFSGRGVILGWMVIFWHARKP